ncbi:hypothetical protein Q7P37_011565 [Cladosporium fusiforme]
MSQRRVPRKIGGDDGEDHMSSGSADTGSETTAITESAIKRPNKPRKSTHLRKSFGPTALQDDEDDTDNANPASVVTPKRSNLSKLAVQRNASKRSSFVPSDLPSETDDGPSYSASDLQALKNSTPSTPQQIDTAGSSGVEDVSASAQALDLNSKFGSSLARYQPSRASSAIPSAAEIEEKKARRARLAAETKADEFISLDPDEPGFDEDEDGNVMKDEAGRLILRPKDKYGMAESRLVRDDEDLMEGFDEFTGETGLRIHMDESTRGGQRERRKAEMAAQIAAAEAEEDSEEGDLSERERNDAFEAAQTRHGNFSRPTDEDSTPARPRTPPKIAPLPSLDGAIARLRAQLAALQTGRMETAAGMQALAREKLRIGEEEVRVQKALRETGEKFEALRREKGIASVAGSGAGTKEGTPALLEAGRGGGLEGRENGVAGDEGEADDEEEDERPRFGLGMGVGVGAAGRGLESWGASSSGAATPAEGAQSDQVMDD